MSRNVWSTTEIATLFPPTDRAHLARFILPSPVARSQRPSSKHELPKDSQPLARKLEHLPEKLRRRSKTDAHRSSVACVYAADKQRRLPPRNCTPAAKCGAFSVFVAEQWYDCSDIGHGVRRKRLPRCEVMFIPRRTRVVSRKEACRSEAVVHLLEIGGACQYVAQRVKWLETEPIATAEFNPGGRHELHQAHRTAR